MKKHYLPGTLELIEVKSGLKQGNVFYSFRPHYLTWFLKK